MANMKSDGTGKFYSIQAGMFVHWAISQKEASQIKRSIGLDFELVDGDTIRAVAARAEANRALLVKEITDSLLKSLSDGLTVSADVDEAAIADAVQLRLADDFGEVIENVNRPRVVS